jgi:hypothetical protein
LIVKISHFGRGKSEKYMKDLSGGHAAPKYLGKNLKKKKSRQRKKDKAKKKSSELRTRSPSTSNEIAPHV